MKIGKVKNIGVLAPVFLMAISLVTSANQKKKRPQVFTSALKKKLITDSVEYFGQISPVVESKIYAPFDAVVVKIKAKTGVPVKKGQLLATLKQNVVGLDVLPLKVTAPIAGKLYRFDMVEAGLVEKNHLLFRIYGPQKFKVDINLAPSDARYIELGQKVDISIGQSKHQGIVRDLSLDIDPKTGTRKVVVGLESDHEHELLPGSLAKVFFEFNQRHAFVVSKDVVKKKGKKNILQLLEQNKVRLLEVNIVKRVAETLEIQHGDLKEGDEIITKSTVSPLLKDQEVERSNEKTDKSKTEEEQILAP